MEITLKYGQGTLSGRLPGKWRVETANPSPHLKIGDPRARLAAFMENPIHSVPFDELFAGKKTVAVIVPDITRKAGVKTLLPPVLEALERIGVSATGITIVFATGIHPPQTDEKKILVVGPAIVDRYTCVDHDSRGDLVQKGGIHINRHVASADGVIVFGAVKIHYLAGFSGGRKAILPGISSYAECIEFHRLSLNQSGPGRHPGTGPGKLEGNPLHERATGAARAVGVDFLVNTVFDEEGDCIFLNGGDLEKSFEQACRFAAGYQIAPIKRKADVVIASAGGYPLDINFIQSHKSLDAACGAVEPRGAVLLVAECADGIGNPDFISWFGYGPSGEMEKMLRRNFIINGQTAFATREKTEKAHVALVSRLDPDDVRRMGMTPVATLEEGIAFCERHAGNFAEALVLYNGGTVIPAVRA